MSGFLLDTHALLWALTDPDRLGPQAIEAIRDRSAQVMVSAASAWELATKHRLGKLPGADAVLGPYDRHLRTLGASDVAVTSAHAILAGRLEWDHRDPFDRILAATAIIEGWTLISRDAAFRALPGVRVRW